MAGKGDKYRPVNRELYELGIDIANCKCPKKQAELEKRWKKLKDKKR